MIDIFMKALKKDKGDIPNHIAIAATNRKLVSAKIPPDKFFTSRFQAINNLIDAQAKYNVRKVTVFVSKSVEDSEYQTEFLQVLGKFLQDLAKNDKIKQHKIKIVVLGKWQNLPDSLVQTITTVMEQTREYSEFQFNICLSYDGRLEIVDAVNDLINELRKENETKETENETEIERQKNEERDHAKIKETKNDVGNELSETDDADELEDTNDTTAELTSEIKKEMKTESVNEMVKQKIISETISVEMINSYMKESVKPDLIIVVDGIKELQGFLLWNSPSAKVYFSDKNMADFSVHDLLKAIAHWQKWNKVQK